MIRNGESMMRLVKQCLLTRCVLITVICFSSRSIHTYDHIYQSSSCPTRKHYLAPLWLKGWKSVWQLYTVINAVQLLNFLVIKSPSCFQFTMKLRLDWLGNLFSTKVIQLKRQTWCKRSGFGNVCSLCFLNRDIFI